MLCPKRNELRRKCAKCYITAAKDSTLSFHRFPLPGKLTTIKACVWAEYCYPTGEWSTVKSLKDLYSQHKMLCSKHFDDSSFTSSAKIRLTNYAIPIGAENLLIKFRQEECGNASGSREDTNSLIEKGDVQEESVPPNKVSCSWQEPTADACSVGDVQEESEPPNEVSFSWQEPMPDACSVDDEANELPVVLDTEIELYDHTRNENSVRPGPKQCQSDGEEKDDQSHAGYKCNECREKIYRFRYSCVQCIDYDICASCEARGVHGTHYMLRVPGTRPHIEARRLLQIVRSQVIKIFAENSVIVDEDEIKQEMENQEDPFDGLVTVIQDKEGTSSETDTNEVAYDDTESFPPSPKRRRKYVEKTNNLDEIEPEKTLQLIAIEEKPVIIPKLCEKEDIIVKNIQEKKQSPRIESKPVILLPQKTDIKHRNVSQCMNAANLKRPIILRRNFPRLLATKRRLGNHVLDLKGTSDFRMLSNNSIQESAKR